MPEALKTYPSPWQGRILLACRKCQKKLKNNEDLRALAKLKKTVKQHNRKHPDQQLSIINVDCMDLCPKDAVTICDPQRNGQLIILRSAEDLERIA